MRVLLDEILFEGLRQPFELLVSGIVRIVEDRLSILVEELTATAVNLRDEGVEKVRQLLIEFINDRMLHSVCFQFFGRRHHLLPSARDSDAGVIQDFLIVNERNGIGVIRKTIELPIIGHVGQRKAGNILL